MDQNIEKVNSNNEYLSKQIFEAALKIIIAFFYWIEKGIELSHKKKKHKKVLLMYLILFIISSIITSFIVHNFMIIGLYMLNTKTQIDLEKYKDVATFAKTLMLCSAVILSCNLQNIFNERYNPVKNIRILIQAILYKFNIKRFFIMLFVNVGVFSVLFYLIEQAVSSYIKNYNITVDLLNQIQVFELLMTFIIFYFIYAWAIEDSIIRTKRRLVLYTISSLFLVITTGNSLYELLVKSEYNNSSLSYIKFLVFIIALLVSVDKVFDSLKSLEKVYSEKENENDRYSSNVYNEVIEYKKYIVESLRNEIVQIFNEFCEIKESFLLLSVKQRLNFIAFLSIIFISMVVSILIISKLEFFASSNNMKIKMISFMDTLPKGINVRLYHTYKSISGIATIIICSIIPILFCIGPIKSINAGIKKAMLRKYSINIFIRDILCGLEMNLILVLIFIMGEIIFLSSLLNINANYFIRYFIYFILDPIVIISAISFIYKKFLDKVDEYGNEL